MEKRKANLKRFRRWFDALINGQRDQIEFLAKGLTVIEVEKALSKAIHGHSDAILALQKGADSRELAYQIKSVTERVKFKGSNKTLWEILTRHYEWKWLKEFANAAERQDLPSTSACAPGRRICDFRVGDLVDWQRFTSEEVGQKRKWHGVIVDDWNTTMDGHWFIIRWDISNMAGSYKGPRTDFNPTFTPYSPHYLQEQCHEIKHCGEVPRLHPKRNALDSRPN